MTDTVSDWLAPKYALAARRLLAAEDAAGQMEILRKLVLGWTLLRRSDLHAERLQIARDRLALSREQTKDRMEEIFRQWAQDPVKMNQTRKGVLTSEERAARIREILRYPNGRFGPQPPVDAAHPSHPTCSG